MPRQKRQHLKQRKDGRFCCTYKGKQFTAYTEEEALAKRNAYKRKVEAGLVTSPTVSAFCKKWLPLYKKGVSKKTYEDYAKQLEALTTHIGHLFFPDVTVTDAKEVYLHFDGYSNSTIKRARMLYIALFDTAMENGYCRRNVFRSKFAQPDRGTEGTHRVITQEERDLILSVQHRMRLPALVMLYAGLRRGEAIALNIDEDVDYINGVIHIRQAVRFDGNKAVTTKTKTAAGKRNVPIFPILSDELVWESGLLVKSAKGKAVTETAFSRGWESYLNALSKAAGHPVKIRCHDLRHSFCTMLRDIGVDMHLAMQWMGHADEKMILRIYDHITEERVTENTERVEKWLSSMRNPMRKLVESPESRID